ncbi:cytochrome c biogenesis protein ResB [Lampropedia puyangensis]|nr:cytochrome c biogenesis protein ResB [Lampropedia puyangensis]
MAAGSIDQHHHWRAHLRRSYRLLSSMPFAIALLCVLALASVIGTVVPQHAPAAQYLADFGPLWASIFALLQLHAIYSAWWFMLILAFLTLSTALCVLRNAPKFIAGMRRYQEHIRISSLKAMPWHVHAQHSHPEPPQQLATQWAQQLQNAGWRVRLQERRSKHTGTQDVFTGWLVAAKRGTGHRWGYIASHSAIVLIGLGGLIDSDFWLRMQAQWSNIAPAASFEALMQTPQAHRLSGNTLAYRGNVLVREGTRASDAIVQTANGYWLQPLPFEIELRQFQREQYATGAAKMFTSVVRIHDQDHAQADDGLIAVNAPLHTHGLSIYQSGFGDSGSPVQLQPVPLIASSHNAPATNPQPLLPAPLHAKVGQQLEMPSPAEARLEIVGIEEAAIQDVRQVDLTAVNSARPALGSSMLYRIRDAAGQAVEFQNYTHAITLDDGVPVYLFGARTAAQEAMVFWRLPQDADGGLQDFVRLLHAMQNPAMRAAAAAHYAQGDLPHAPLATQTQLAQSSQQVLDLFVSAWPTTPQVAPASTSAHAATGLEILSQFIETHVPTHEQTQAANMMRRVLTNTLLELLQQARALAHLPARDPQSPQTQAFMQAAVASLNDMVLYPATVFYTLRNFTPVYTSVLLVSKAPGRYLVYPGCVLLVVGLFIMLFVRERRLWVWIHALPTQANMDTHQVTIAMSSNRPQRENSREFTALTTLLLGTQRTFDS